MARVDDQYTDCLNGEQEQEHREAMEAFVEVQMERAIEDLNRRGLVVVSQNFFARYVAQHRFPAERSESRNQPAFKPVKA